MSTSKHDKKELQRAARFPLILVTIIWLVKIVEVFFDLDFSGYGLYPLELKGLRGMLFAPFIHGDWKHLFNNTFPLLFLTWSLFYFYRAVAVKVFLLVFFVHSFWLWFFGRYAYHIGASGVIYGLSAFILVSGLIRKNTHLLAIALVVAFLYGSFVWGIFPRVKEVSWEAHLTGMVAGIILAFYYKDFGPEPNIGRWKHVYTGEDSDPGREDSDEIMLDEKPYWDTVDELSDEDKNLLK